MIIHKPLTVVLAGATLALATLLGLGSAGAVGSSPKFNEPWGIATSGGDAFITNGLGHSVTEINSTTGAVVRVISGASYDFDGLSSIVVSGGNVFVTDAGGPGRLTEFSAATGKLVRVLTASQLEGYGVGITLGSLAVNGPDLFIVGDTSVGSTTANPLVCGVLELNVASGKLIRVIKGASYNFQDCTTISFGGGDGFVVNTGPVGTTGPGWVTEFNATTGKFVRVIKGASYKFELSTIIGAKGSEAFVAGPTYLSEISTATGKLVRVLSAKSYGFSEPEAISFDGPDTFVANLEPLPSNAPSGSITEFNTATGKLVRVFTGASYHFDGPGDIVVRGDDAFVTNSFNSTVTEFSVTSGKVVRIFANAS